MPHAVLAIVDRLVNGRAMPHGSHQVTDAFQERD